MIDFLELLRTGRWKFVALTSHGGKRLYKYRRH